MRLMGVRRRAAGYASAAAGTTTFGRPPTAAAELQRVEDRLRTVARSADDRLVEIALHGIDAGGKRMRPLLAISSALAVAGRDGVTDRVIDAAVAVELLHLASLYHDDVLDSATVRRGQPSVNALWGNHAAVLGGDVLLAHAYRVAAELGPSVLLRLAQTLTELCAGQIAETEAQFNRARTISAYDASIRGKTASLLATSCWLGATTAGGSRLVAEALGRFGTNVGIAFQVVDDVLDLYGESHAIGKPAGSDLREGVFTLPVLMTLRDDPSLRELLVEGVDADGVEEVARRVRRHGGDRRAVAVALGHLDAALAHLGTDSLAPEGTRLLASIAGLVLEPLDRLGLRDAAAAVPATTPPLPAADAA